MTFVFPHTPTVGQRVTGPNGFTYVWTGVKWVTEAEADRFLPLAGGTMTGAIILPGDATQPLEAVPMQQLSDTISHLVVQEVLVAGALTGTTLVEGTWRAMVMASVGLDTQGGFHQPWPHFYRPKVPGIYYFQIIVGLGSGTHGGHNGIALMKNIASDAQTTALSSGTSMILVTSIGISNYSGGAIVPMNGTTDHISLWLVRGLGSGTGPASITNPALMGYLLRDEQV